MGKPKKTATPPSKLSPRVRAILARTRKARAELDARLVGYVDDDPTPVMVVTGPPRRRKGEQQEELETVAIAPAEREKRARKTAKARQKRADNAKARRARQQEMDAAADACFVSSATTAREVVESLKPVMVPSASLHGVRIG